MINKKNRALSNVLGAIMMIIIITLVSSLFLAIFRYNESIQQATNIENSRTQEKILLIDLTTKTESGTEYITSLTITNNGSITSQIKAVYINGEFHCDPSDISLNPQGTFINNQESKNITITQIPYDPTAKISVATERGMKAIQYASNLRSGDAPPPSDPVSTSYGPLRLNFTLFYYAKTDALGTPVDIWKDGWNVQDPKNLPYCAWNITVTNIEKRDITLNGNSTLTLVSNGGGGQLPWFLKTNSFFIAANSTIHLIYVWDEPASGSAQGFSGTFTQTQTAKVFLTFFGEFSDKTTYGQTVPFEAVLVNP